MAEKMLNCTDLQDVEFEKIKQGYEVFKLTSTLGKPAYFGAVTKPNMKQLTKWFKYVDKATLVKGGILGAGAVLVGQKLSKMYQEHKNINLEEEVPEEES